MANALKLTIFLLFMFYLMSNAKGNPTVNEDGIVHGNSLSGGAQYNYIPHEKNNNPKEG